MNMEKTLIIIKPDSFSKQIVGQVIGMLEAIDLKPAGAKMIRMDSEKAGRFYVDHKDKHFFGPLVDFMSSNPVMVMVWEGDDAISRARELMGATDPAEAEDGTIRKKWAADGRHNIIHGSDSPGSAEREIAYFFNDSEIFQWDTKDYSM
ncbi:nucleoside-diphosphate kinase [Elusimicrobiota bacterium]